MNQQDAVPRPVGQQGDQEPKVRKRPEIVARIGANRYPAWYVKGSYLLDVLFHVNFATEIDIFWLSALGEPTEEEVRRWLKAHNFHAVQSIDRTRVKDFLSSDGGGEPQFNIDFWQIHMDGNLYVGEPHNALFRVLSATAIIPLQAVGGHSIDPIVAEKALRKMRNYPALHNPELENRLKVRTRAPRV